MLHKVSSAVGRRFLTVGLLISLTTFGTAGLVGQKEDGQETSAVPEAIFTNPAAITINDADIASPYPSNISVAGLTGTITSVKVTLNSFSHTFPDDVGIVLKGPTGAALLLQDGAGDNPDMVNVTYTIADSGAAVLPNLTAWAAGTYKPTNYYFPLDSFPAPGPLTAYNNPGPAGSGTATFASTYNGTAPNGTWSLYVADFVGGDEGTISGGWTLEITTNAPTAPPQHVVDFDGNGRTDYTVIRNTGGGPGGQLTWIYALNPSGATFARLWGLQGDEFVPEDYDGDNSTDLAIWRPAEATFYILRSNGFTLRVEQFGISTDDPSVVGDYNNDGSADLAVYRTGASAGAASFWFWRTTPGGPVNQIHWGQNGDFPVPGDFNGDGSHDFVVQRNAGGGQARFWRFLSGGTIDSFIFGTPTDVILPGDYDGDAKTDIAVVRGSSGFILWHIRNSSDGSTTPAFFGLSATDFPAVGDYDGDGTSDIAIWRPSGTAGASGFWIKNSSNATTTARPFGQNGDYPVANYNNH